MWGFVWNIFNKDKNMELRDRALEIAITQIGQKEDPIGSNWGHPVKDYLAAVGITFPASWCMAFVYWCYVGAAKYLAILPIPLIRSGGVLHVWENTSSKRRFSTPEIGDIFIIDFGHGLGHTGIVEYIDGEFIHTVEGNTNDTGSREGIEVCRRRRTIKSMKGFIRI